MKVLIFVSFGIFVSSLLNYYAYVEGLSSFTSIMPTPAVLTAINNQREEKEDYPEYDPVHVLLTLSGNGTGSILEMETLLER